MDDQRNGGQECPPSCSLFSGLQSLPVSVAIPDTEGVRPRRIAQARIGRISTRQLALFTRQLSVMLGAGVSLVSALHNLARQEKNRALGPTLRQIRYDVEPGSTLAAALERHPRVFDPLFVNLVRAGETGGFLDTVFKRLTRFLEKKLQWRKAVLSASLYPAVVIVTSLLVLGVILVWVIPVFASLFANLDVPLPLPTRMVMGASGFLSRWGLLLSLGMGAAGLSGAFYVRSGTGRKWLDRSTLAAPLVGQVTTQLLTARFARTLSTLLSSGVPILEAMDLTGRTLGNTRFQEAVLEVRSEVESGSTLAEPLGKSGLFPKMASEIIQIGELTGTLDDMLLKLAVFYEEEADTSISRFLALLEPMMMLFLGIVVGGMVLSMYMPIFSLMGRLSQF